VNSYIIEAIVILALANIITRALPFWILKNAKEYKLLGYIEKRFPLIILVILIFYTLINVDFSTSPFAYKEIIGILTAIILHLIKGNYLLSIFGSTLVYMALVQMLN